MSEQYNESRNPYNKGDCEPRLRRSVVTFVDILGYKEMIGANRKKRESEALLGRLHRALSKSRSFVDPKTKEEVLKIYSPKDMSAMRAFTDNIVIGRPLRHEAYVELAAALQEISFFQLTMAINGFFFRGGIAIENLYMDEIAVFGNGLSEAYKAEVESARDPRIVLAPSAKKAVDLFFKSGSKEEIADFNRYILRDLDGQYFVDYMSTLFREDGKIYLNELRGHRRAVSEKLKAHYQQPAVWSKYKWVANYHNYICSESTEIPGDYKVHPSELAESPARLVSL